jgi:predicted HicB family RNase H-like nuclease
VTRSEPYKFPLRLPADLYEVAKAEAVRQECSVNTLLVALIAGGLHFKLPKEKTT